MLPFRISGPKITTAHKLGRSDECVLGTFDSTNEILTTGSGRASGV